MTLGRVWLAIVAVVAAAAASMAASAPPAWPKAPPRRPVVTAVAALGSGSVRVDWANANAIEVRVKRDCYSCGLGGAIYKVANTGTVTLAGQPSGLHYYRVCDLTCSLPVAVTVD